MRNRLVSSAASPITTTDRVSVRPLRTAVAAVSVAGLLALSACGGGGADSAGEASGDWPDPLVVAVIPSEEQRDLEPSDSIPMRMLMDELGIDIEYHTATSYAATIEAQRSGEAQMANYGPFSYVLAADSGAGVEPIAAAAESADDVGGYHAVASVRADSDIDSLEDAEGKSVCFVDPASTSGYLFPSAALLDVGIDPEGGDISPVMSGAHDASVLALVDGQCEIAFSTEGMATEQLIETGQVEEGQIKQIWKSEQIPSDPYAVSSSLPEDLKKAIQDTLVNKVNVDAIKDTEYWDDSADDEFGGLGGWGYTAVDDSVYDVIREVCEKTQSESCAAAQ